MSKSKSFFEKDFIDVFLNAPLVDYSYPVHNPKYKKTRHYVKEKDDGAIELFVDVIGHGEKSLNINLYENSITIKGECNEDNPSFVENIELNFDLPEGYDGTKTTGNVENGILTLIIEKKEGKKPKQLKL